MEVTTRRTLLSWSFLAACAGGFTVVASQAPAQAVGTAADEEAIRKVMTQAAEAFNNHDAAAVAAFYTADADLVNVRGEAMKGSAEIERGLARAFATRYRNAHMKRGEVTIRFLRPDVALAQVANEISGASEAEGRSAPPHRELGIRVFVKDGGVWRIAALLNSPVVGR